MSLWSQSIDHSRAKQKLSWSPVRCFLLLERAGGKVLVEPAPAWNVKVTAPEDLRVAELLLRSGAG